MSVDRTEAVIDRPVAQVGAFAGAPSNATVWYERIESSSGGRPACRRRLPHGLRGPQGSRGSARPSWRPPMRRANEADLRGLKALLEADAKSRALDGGAAG